MGEEKTTAVKPNHVARTLSDARRALREQVSLLTSYAAQYDAGHHAYAKPMAAALRLLIHHTKYSTSLLHQLGLRQGRFFTAASKIDPENMVTECKLIAVHMQGSAVGNSIKYVPCLRPLGFRERVAFHEWWRAPILRGRQGVTMSRQDVVTAVADMDGGAHVDPTLESKYHAFRTGELLGWGVTQTPGKMTMWVGMIDGKPETDPDGEYMAEPQYACVRTITHEFLLTMQKYVPGSFDQPYAPSEPDEPGTLIRQAAGRA